MSSEPQESYPFSSFPLTQEAPQPVYTYFQKMKYFPRVVIVNKQHEVSWKRFVPVRGPLRIPSGALGQDVAPPTLPEYVIGIEYSEHVPLDELVCKGIATPVV